MQPAEMRQSAACCSHHQLIREKRMRSVYTSWDVAIMPRCVTGTAELFRNSLRSSRLSPMTGQALSRSRIGNPVDS